MSLFGATGVMATISIHLQQVRTLTHFLPTIINKISLWASHTILLGSNLTRESQECYVDVNEKIKFIQIICSKPSDGTNTHLEATLIIFVKLSATYLQTICKQNVVIYTFN